MKIENLFICVIAALVFYLFMQNFLGVVATKFIMQGLIIIAICCGFGWLGFQGYAIIQEKMLNIANLKIQIARNRYITHDTSDCLAIDTNMGDMQFFTNKRQPKPEKTIIEVPDESQVFIEDNTPMTALDYALDIDRAIVVGGTRSGKTYFCKQVAYRRIKERGDIIFAIDVKDYDPDDAWCDGVRTVGTGDNYHQIEQFWKWLISEKQRRGQDMRRTKQEPNILILFDEINVTLYERPDFIAPYLAVLQKFAQYKIGIWAIGQADHKDGLGLPSVALKSNFGATFLFEGENGKHLKNYYRKNPDSCLTTPANSLLLEPYQPVRFDGVMSGNQAKRQPQETHRAYPDRYDSPDKSDYPDYRKIGYDTEMGGEAVYDEPIRFFESKAQKTAYELSKRGLTPYQIAKKIFPFVNGQKTAKIKQWLSEM